VDATDALGLIYSKAFQALSLLGSKFSDNGEEKKNLTKKNEN
jgi:hypothetical protein